MNDYPRLDNYHILELIAEGGTAKVYKAVDLRSGFLVAIKELKTRHLKNSILRKKFKDVETQLYLYMQHPNIPKLVDFLEPLHSDSLFLVMEYVEGITLEDFIYKKIGLIPEERALPIFIEILNTVGYIHDNNILHLDIKSNNVMLLPNGKVKLIDLGIASRLGDLSANTGYGTPPYMPPEQSEKGTLGRYTDIFALGVLLFEMLTGRLPFFSYSENAKEEIRRQIKYSPTPLMVDFYPMIGEGLQRIVEKALAKNPQERFLSCQEFLNAIRKYGCIES